MFAGMGGGPMGMGGFGSRRAAPSKGGTVQRELPCTLEELYTGCTKRMKITRKRLNPDNSVRNDEKVLSINVKAGWKAGTALTFDGEGDQLPGVIPADVKFVISEKPHDRFKREGNDLVYTARISLADALAGCVVNVVSVFY